MPRPVDPLAAQAYVANGPEQGEWAKKYPNLAGWLCDTQYPDGSAVGRTKLSLERDGGKVRAVLQLQDSGGIRVETYGPTPCKALAALEALLSSGDTPWQPDKWPLGGLTQPKRKK